METDLRMTVESITPEKALEYLTHNKVNRPLNKAQVEFYAEEMRKGEWVLNGESIQFTRNGELVNGNHRMHAVIKAGIPVKFTVIRNVDDNSFARFDSGRNRGLGDVLSIADVPNYCNVASILKRYYAIKNDSPYFMSDNRSTGRGVHLKIKKSNAFYLDLYNSNSNFIQEIYRFSQKIYTENRIMKITEIGGVCMYLILDKKHPKEFVYSFFEMFANPKVCSNNTIDVFRQKLINDKCSTIRMTTTYISQLLIKTWNSYVKNKDLKVLSWNESVEGKLQFM
jgi:hypothetical protein